MNANRTVSIGSILIANVFAQAAPIERSDFAFEQIDASDVTLLQTSAAISTEGDAWQSDISLSASEFEFDYEPVSFDFNGSPVERSERNYAFQINTRRSLGEDWTLMLGGGAYDGYTNYRSAWLDEYYRQQFSNLNGVPGAELYGRAKPNGFNASAGLRWAYRPSSAYAQLSVSQLQDDVSPGYEIDFEGLRRGQTTLATSAISLSTENIITKRVRSLLSLRASQTSERDWRYGAELALNAALGEQWIARFRLGASTEDPTFDAWYAGFALERTLDDRFSLYLDGRYYDDTGEIENAFLFTNAAPGTRSERIGLGLKWTGQQWSGRIYLAHIDTRFDPPQGNVDFFRNLYADRDWTVFQLAFSRAY